jgi:D-methionine transport system ATP-binding protein
MNITIVIVTHQMEVIKQAASRVILLDGGEVKASGKVEELFVKPTAKLKKLIGEEELLPESGINIRILFPEGNKPKLPYNFHCKGIRCEFFNCLGEA